MYRDAKQSLDERDRAVGAILIGEALIASCERAHVAREAMEPHAWRAIRDAHDEFPEVWRSLDQARAMLARRGANVAGYDELRPRMRTRLATAGDDDEVHVDPAALEDARRAAHALKLAVPGADWAAIDQRTSGLVRAPLVRRRRMRLTIAALMVLFAIAVTTWASAIMPGKRRDPKGDMRRELAGIVLQRKIKVVELTAALDGRCLPVIAHDLARALVMDGRSDDAKQLASSYAARCGADDVLDRWAAAPRPR